MKRTSRRAFTLAELMTVVSVIALLAAVLVPALSSVFDYQRMIACKNNLEQLGVAYGTIYYTRQVKGERGIGSLGHGWPKQFSTYVSGSKKVFWCPAGEGEGKWEKASLDQYYDEVYIGANYQGAMSLSENASPFVWRLSETQFRQFLASPGHGRGYSYTGYTPDSNPDVYYYLLEDNAWRGGGDMDFWDVNYRVETDGINYKLTVATGYTAYFHNLILGQGASRKVLIPDVQKHNGQTVEVKGKGVATYGLNTVGDQVLPGTGGKILIMDYNLEVAAGSQYDETGERARQLVKDWIPDPNNPSNGPRFARHYRKANVLFTDGSVKLMRISDIHPGIVGNCAKYWDPQ
jgi:prepilin-type N-terminal cleavage/methylation domain-containing protein/prepilin-type processing-associated H-X9-DG protein